jgi:hypothetical protein
LIEDGGDRNSGAFDDRLTTAYTRVNLNALAHAINHTRPTQNPQARETARADVAGWRVFSRNPVTAASGRFAWRDASGGLPPSANS